MARFLRQQSKNNLGMNAFFDKIYYKGIINLLNFLVLLCAMAIIGDVSYRILSDGVYDPSNSVSLKIQLWVCVIFMLDFIVRIAIEPEKLKFVKRNFLLLLFSIPYLNFVHYEGIELSKEAHFALSLVPLLRAGFGLVVIIRWITKRSVTSLLFSYLIVLASVTYFSSLLFFVTELNVNPNVHSYWDALWWACMDMTTVGSNIVAVTTIGKFLSVFLAASGMMMLPIFTVYITDKMVHARNKDDQKEAQESEKSKQNAKLAKQ